jgi:hypothetical protein
MKKNEQGTRDLWDIVKHTNLYIIGTPKKKKGQKEKKILKKQWAKTF